MGSSAQKRKTYTEIQNISLTTQVRGVCPLCDARLFYKKIKRSQKNYEIAHIYPLNPTREEVALLNDEEKLSSAPNDEDNVIPLCVNCHKQFDTPRTVEEYRKLVAIKKRLIARSKQESLWGEYPIEAELRFVVEALYADFTPSSEVSISYNPKSIDEKTNDSISRPTVRRIRNCVADYYEVIRDQFAALDRSNPEFSSLVSAQIRLFYIKQKGMGLEDQQEVFENIVCWLQSKTKPRTSDAAEILASFFVQNCEVFE